MRKTTVFAMLSMCAAAAQATIFTVTSSADSGAGTLRAAMTALTAGSDHTINFNLPANSTINLNTQLPPIRGNSVFIDGFGAPGLTVTATASTRVFEVDGLSPTQSLSMRLFHVTGGRAGSGGGGCLYDPIQPVRSALIILDHMVFQGCQATGTADNRGGAISAGTFLIVQDSEFNNNSAFNAPGVNASGNVGGAIYAFGTLSLSNTRFVGNEARANAPAVSATGAAIYSLNTVTVSRSHFTGNRVIGGQGTAYGTAYCAGSSSCTYQQSSFRDNTNIALATFSPNVTITNCTFVDNVSGSSLYIFPRTGQTRLNNLSFLRRIATTDFGASHLTMQAVSGQTPDIAMANSLFGPTGGQAPACGFSVGIASNGGGYNIAVDNSCNTFANGTSAVIPGNLGMLDPAVVPGSAPSEVIALAANSQALDVGSPGIPNIDANACISGDARGALRPQDGNDDGTSICDVGAYEVLNPRIFADGFEN